MSWPRLWVWVALTCSAGAGVAFAVPGTRLTDVTYVYATLFLASGLAALMASMGLYLRWRMAGEAPVGLLAAALAVGSLPPLLLWALPMGAGAPAALGGVHQLSQLAAGMVAALLLYRSVRAPKIDTSVSPVALAGVYGGVATVLMMTVGLGVKHELIPHGAATAVVADGLLATLYVGFAVLFMRASTLARPVAVRLAVAFLGLGVASSLAMLAHVGWTGMLALSGYLSLAATGLMFVLAAALLRTVLDFTRERLYALSQRAECAENEMQLEQERRHELRSTLAGIRSASAMLSGYPHRIDQARQRTMQQMMVQELERLERLLDRTPESASAIEPVAIDTVLSPLVSRHRQAGMTLRWRPCGAQVMARPDELAETLNILLTNADSHAPGRAVEVTVEEYPSAVRLIVRDDGPGVPPELIPRIFDRGVRSPNSPGQGIGLHVAHKLTAAQGGSLRLLRSPGQGAAFALTLPRARLRIRSVLSQHTTLKDAI